MGVVLSLRFVSTQTKKADSSHLISPRDDRENERKRSTTLINDEEKRKEKKKKRRKERRRERSAAHKRTKNKIFASFFHNPKVERMSWNQSNGQTISMIL